MASEGLTHKNAKAFFVKKKKIWTSSGVLTIKKIIEEYEYFYNDRQMIADLCLHTEEKGVIIIEIAVRNSIKNSYKLHTLNPANTIIINLEKEKTNLSFKQIESLLYKDDGTYVQWLNEYKAAHSLI